MTSTQSSVIYFGGQDQWKATDRVVEYRNLKWISLGYLVSERRGHRSIQMENKIYIFGGAGKT